MTTDFSIPLILSSSTASGAYNVSSGNDKFDTRIESDVIIPSNAKQITVEVQSASIWYTPYNISAELANNKLYLDVSGDAVYTITLDDGLYELSSLAHAVDVSLVNQGLATGLVTFTADLATQRIVINYSVAGLRFDFTRANTCRTILGFANAVVPVAYTTAVTSVYGTSTAQFNSVDHFLIHSDIVSGGITINGVYSNVIARVLINARPGNLIAYQPVEPTRVPASNLAGTNITRIHSYISDQDGGSLDFNGENWDVMVVIRWKM